MPYASLRNAIPRKTNKERSQPAARKKFGLLEKHKDYVQRANDYKRKSKALASLREKAAFRNPDEFYFAMTKGQTKEGVHRVRPAEASLPHDHIALLKTQDMRYVTMKRALDVKKAEKLQAGLHFLTEEAANKHTVFVDTEAEVETFDPAKHFGTDPALVTRAFNRPKLETLETPGAVLGVANVGELKKVRKAREKAYTELGERLKRSLSFKEVLEHMQVEKNVMGKGRKRKVQEAEDGKPAVFKWKRERRK
ncbi:hypothetical protein NSK_003302 [Nannochloropsis salina CCMP1776]|uniref:U3 small nucleolar RNA-associated protein 11 n=1 Tax=Nannochloropsis salina CCMP1776 TaxID=1027361 RepID=A0A4D9DA46_9STRA|nr:hypothetical protein NSK_003302 [Nannochloropsis salina CCMP1776]|eukprot:TFJ85429.1 hypothetical protein NSK_003302 [Nannochloropsis salina CCMP1776]